MLQILDTLWKEHLATMDHLRQGIGLRGYAGRNPKQEYKREAFELFQSMLQNMKDEFIRFLALVQLQPQDDPECHRETAHGRSGETKPSMRRMQEAESATAGESGQPSQSDAQPVAQPVTREGRKVGRNEPCPCGSGKKYKQCHGKVA